MSLLLFPPFSTQSDGKLKINPKCNKSATFSGQTNLYWPVPHIPEKRIAEKKYIYYYYILENATSRQHFLDIPIYISCGARRYSTTTYLLKNFLFDKLRNYFLSVVPHIQILHLNFARGVNFNICTISCLASA